MELTELSQSYTLNYITHEAISHAFSIIKTRDEPCIIFTDSKRCQTSLKQ